MTAKKQNNKMELNELISLTNVNMLYTWIKYADDEKGSNMSDEPKGKTFIGIAYNKDTIEESNLAKDYKWSRIVGSKGEGISSVKNYFLASEKKSGVTRLTEGWTETPQTLTKEKKYLWTYEEISYTDGKVVYTDPHIMGTLGDDGVGIKEHIEYYAVNNNYAVAPTKWQTTPPVMNNDNRYLWNYETVVYTNNKREDTEKRIIGVHGDPGVKGESSYFHLKYSKVPNPEHSSQMQEEPAMYAGTYVDKDPIDSNDPKRYKWHKIEGTDGLQGENGDNGETSYLHIKYSNDGGKTFTGNNGEVPGSWIGQYVDFVEKDSDKTSSYKWSKIKGDTGNAYTIKGTLEDTNKLPEIGKEGEAYIIEGYLWGWIIGPDGRGSWANIGKIKGENGKDGITLYTWIKYADDTKGTGMSNNAAGKKYIGVAYNKTTQEESDDYTVYTWSKIQADDFRIEGTLGSDKELPPKGRPGMCYIIGKNLWTWKEDPKTGIGSWADMGQFVGNDGAEGAKVVVADTYTREFTEQYWKIFGTKGRSEQWDRITNASSMKKNDIIVINGVVTDKNKIGASIYAVITNISGTTVTATSQSLIMGNQGQQGVQGEQGRSVVIADTNLRYVPFSELDEYMRETEIHWTAIRNTSAIKKGDILGVRHCITDKKNAIAIFYYLVQRIEGSTVYGKPLYYQMGPEGPAGPILDWVQEWDGTKTTIGGKKVLSPRIFAGTVSGGKPTGVALGENCFGSLNGYQSVKGLCAYHDGNQTFSVTSNGDVYFGDPTGRNGLIQYNAGNLSISAEEITFKGNDLYDSIAGTGGQNLIKNGEAKLGINNWINNGNGIAVASDQLYKSCFEMRTMSNGLLPGIRGDEIRLKPDTDYVYQALIYSGRESTNHSSTSPIHFWCSTSSGTAGQNACQIIDYYQHYNTLNKWQRLYVHFKTSKSGAVYFTPFIHGNFPPNELVWATQIMLSEGTIPKIYTSHPEEVFTKTVSVSDEGLTVKSNGSSSKTIVDESSFRVVDGEGGTIAEFSKSSNIPHLRVSDLIVTNTLKHDNLFKKYDHHSGHKIYVDSKRVTSGSPSEVFDGKTRKTAYTTIERAFEDIYECDARDVEIECYGGYHRGFYVSNKKGPGFISILFEPNSVIAGDIEFRGTSNVYVSKIGAREGNSPVIKGGILLFNCSCFDIDGVAFRKRENGTSPVYNILVKNTTHVNIRFCDLGHVGTGNSCVRAAHAVGLNLFHNSGSDCGYYLAAGTYSIVCLPHEGHKYTCPDYTHGLIDWTNTVGTTHILGSQNPSNFHKTPSTGWDPVYRPYERTDTWYFNNIYSTEDMRGYKTKYELIQGRCDEWGTGRWTGYIKRTDSMSSIREALSGAWNIDAQVYIQRTPSSGVSSGGVLQMYTSNGSNALRETVRMSRSEGKWVRLSDAAIREIQNGSCTYFYLYASNSNQTTYFKCETNCKFWARFTK